MKIIILDKPKHSIRLKSHTKEILKALDVISWQCYAMKVATSLIYLHWNGCDTTHGAKLYFTRATSVYYIILLHVMTNNILTFSSTPKTRWNDHIQNKLRNHANLTESIVIIRIGVCCPIVTINRFSSQARGI